MAKVCNCILVIGSNNSSNSKRLVEVAKINGAKNALLISNEKDLNYFLKYFNPKTEPNLGLTSGASAPETLVQILISKLKENFKVNQIDHEVIKEDIHFNLPKSSLNLDKKLAVYTKIELEDLLEILEQYSIGNLIEFSGIRGIENTNYYIKEQIRVNLF